MWRTESTALDKHEIQTTISSILKLALEPISLGEQLERTLDLVLSLPWLGE